MSLWDMDETSGSTMHDGVGSNNGTLHSVALNQTGFVDAAYGFNGSSSVVTVPTSASLNPGTSPFWFSAHVKFTGTPTAAIGGDYDLIRKGLSGTSGGFYKMELLPGSSGVRLHCSMEGSTTSHSLTAGPDLRDNEWHTVTCAKDDSSISAIVDGVKASDSIALGSFGNSAQLAIGAKAEGGDWYDGLMDEVSFGTGAPDAPTAPPAPIPSPAPAPAPATVAPPPASTPSPATSGPGTIGNPVVVASEACARVLPGTVLRKAKLGGAAKLTLRFDARTGTVRITAPHGKVRTVTLTLDGKRLRSVRGGSLATLLHTKGLASGTHVLRATVRPRHGKVLTLTVWLVSASC